MPRLKTASEVATMAYLRERTKVPVPHVFHWDANPYNRLGGEFIFLQKARLSAFLFRESSFLIKVLGRWHSAFQGLSRLILC